MNRGKTILAVMTACAMLFSFAPATFAGADASFDAKTVNYSQNPGGSWTSSISAEAGNEVLFLLSIANNASSTMTDLRVKASLPGGISRVDGTTKQYLGSAQTVLANTIDTSGVVVTDLAAGGNCYVSFKAKLASSGLTVGDTLSPSFLLYVGSDSKADSVAITVLGSTTSGSSNLTVNMQGNNWTDNPSGSWAGSVTAGASDEVLFMLGINNTGNAAATTVKANITLPGGMSRIDNQTKLYSGSTVTVLPNTIDTTGVDLSSLSAGSNVYITTKVKLASAGLANGETLQTVGKVSSATQSNISDSLVVTVSGTTSQGNANLSVAATANNWTQNPSGSWADPISAKASDEVLFMINIQNTGDGEATGMKIQADFPGGLSRVDDSTKIFSGSTQTVLANTIDTTGIALVNLSANANYYVTTKAKLASTGLTNGQSLTVPFTMTSTNSGSKSDNVVINVTAVNSPSVTGQPTMSAKINNWTYSPNAGWTNSVGAMSGDEVLFQIGLTNPSNGELLQDVNLSVSYPTGVDRVDNLTKIFHSNLQTVLPNTINTGGVTLMNLSPDSNYYVTTKVKLGAVTAGVATITFRITADDGISLTDSVTLNISGTSNPVTFNAEVINWTKNASGNWAKSATADPGDEILYRLEIKNNSNSTIGGVNVSVALPAGMTRVDNLTKLFHGNQQTVLPNTIDSTGVGLLDLAGNSNYYVTYKVKLAADETLRGQTLKPNHKLTMSGVGPFYDDSAVVTVLTVTPVIPPVTPPVTPPALPPTGPATIVTLLLMLITFGAITSYIYIKERKALKLALHTANDGSMLAPDKKENMVGEGTILERVE